MKIETPLDVTLSPQPAANPTCGGQDVVIDIQGFKGVAPYQVSWVGGTNGAFKDSTTVSSFPLTVANVPPGTFCVTVTDATGCTGSECVTVVGSPVMQIQATGTAVTCADSLAGTIKVEFVVPGKAPYTIHWGGTPVNIQGLPYTITGLTPGDYCVTVTDANGCTAKACARVETALDIVLNPIPPANVDCGGKDVVVSIAGTEQGTPDYKVVWNSAAGMGMAVVSAFPYTIPNVAPGNFSVTVTDATGCSGSERTIVTGDPVMIIKANATALTCVDSLSGTIKVEFVVKGNPGYTIQLVGVTQPVAIGDLPYTFTGLGFGVYTVLVTDSKGCTATTTAKVESAIDVTLTPTAASDPKCGGGNLIINVKSGGTPPFKYTWAGPFMLGGTVDPAVFPDTLKNLPLGTYSVTVTDANGCTGVENATILGAPKMVISADSVSNLTCTGGGSDGMIVVKMLVPGVAPYSITWTGGPTVPNATFPYKINGLKEGHYVITVTDSRGCTATATAFINTALDVELKPIAGSNLTCTGAKLIVTVKNGGTAPFVVKWSGPTSGTHSNVTLPDTLQNLQPGTYVVTVTDALGCTGTDSATITGDSTLMAAATGTDLSCAGNGKDGKVTVVLIQATQGPYKVTWTPTGSAQNVSFPFLINDLPAGTVKVTVTDKFGCTATAEVKLSGGPADVDIEVVASDTVCQDTFILVKALNLDPQDTLTYAWTGSSPNLLIDPANSPSPKVSANTPGAYTLTLTATNQFGCTKVLTQPLTFKELESLQGLIKANLCNGLLVQFDNTTDMTGKWDFGDGQTSEELDPTHKYEVPKQYAITFNPNQECVKPFDTTITVVAIPAVIAGFGFELKDCFKISEIKFADSTKFAGNPKNWAWTFNTVPPQSSTEQNPVIKFKDEGLVEAQLIVTDVNGCADTLTQELKINIVRDSIEKQFDFCVGDTIKLNPDGSAEYLYNWASTPPDPSLVKNDPKPIVTPQQATIYTVTIKKGDDCKVDYTANVDVKPTVTGIVAPDSLNVCDSDPVTLALTGSNGISFKWSDSPTLSPVIGTGSSVTVIPVKDGVWYYEALNGEDCPLKGKVKLNLGALDITPSPLNQNVCLGAEAILTIGNTDPNDVLTFQWNPVLDPTGNPVVIPTESGAYTVTVSNQFGCADTITFNVKVIDLAVTAEIVGKDTICIGETAQLLATVTGNVANPKFSWTPAGTLTGANTANPVAKPDQPTWYTVTATTPEGLCPDTAGVALHVITSQCVEPFIFVPKAFTPNGDDHNDRFIVRGVNITEVLFIVWDRWGEEVYRTTDVNATGWDGTYNGKELTPDSYAWYLRARCGNGAEYVKKGDVTLLK